MFHQRVQEAPNFNYDINFKTSGNGDAPSVCTRVDKAASTYIIDCIIPDLCSHKGVAMFEYACVTLTVWSYLPTPTYQHKCRFVFAFTEVVTCCVEHWCTHRHIHHGINS